MTSHVISHWRLILSTVFHGLAGYSSFFYVTLYSPIELWVKEFANRSVVAHYGMELSEQTVEWIWAGTSSEI